MKATREFWFFPQWKSRGYSWETYDDRYLIPSFNEMAKILNDRGWEIIEYEIIKDTTCYCNDKDFNTARFVCSKEVATPFVEEKYHYFAAGHNGELELL